MYAERGARGTRSVILLVVFILTSSLVFDVLPFRMTAKIKFEERRHIHCKVKMNVDG